MLFDTHCHIYKEYYEDIDLILNKTKDSGVACIINNACNLSTCLEVIELSKKYNNIFYVLGLHPGEDLTEIDKVVELINNNINDKKMIGIGEIGLDYHYGRENIELQKDIFRRQLDLAQKYKLPVIIHSREATQNTLDILKEYDLKGIIHCFNGSVEIAKEYIKKGYKIGVNGVVTFSNCKLISVLKELSIDDIVFETDSPYLTPVPNRGKTNDPSYVNDVVNFVSDNLGVSREELIISSYNSIKDIFDRI